MPDPQIVAALLRTRLEAGPIEVPAEGTSMASTITPGSTVVIAGSPRPRMGEIWAFVAPDGKLVVHRYRRSVPGAYLFRGDGNQSNDRPVQVDRVVGRVTAARSESGEARFGEFDRLRAVARQVMSALWHRVGRRGS